jgi:hypothetical protein
MPMVNPEVLTQIRTCCVTEVIHESDVNIHSRDDVWLGIDHVTTGSLSDHEWNVLIVYD